MTAIYLREHTTGFYGDSALQKIGDTKRKTDIQTVAQQLGISAAAIAGAIAEEYDSQGVIDLLQLGVVKGRTFSWAHEEWLADYDEVVSEGEKEYPDLFDKVDRHARLSCRCRDQDPGTWCSCPPPGGSQSSPSIRSSTRSA